MENIDAIEEGDLVRIADLRNPDLNLSYGYLKEFQIGKALDNSLLTSDEVWYVRLMEHSSSAGGTLVGGDTLSGRYFHHTSLQKIYISEKL